MSLTTRLLLVAAVCVAAAGAIAYGAPAAVAGPVVALTGLLLALPPRRAALAQAIRAVSTREHQPRAVRIISRIGLGATTMAIGAAAAGVALKHGPADVTAVISAPDVRPTLAQEPVTELDRRQRDEATPTPTASLTLTPSLTPTPEGTVAEVPTAAQPTKTTGPKPQHTQAPNTPAPTTPPQSPAPPDPTPTEEESASLTDLVFGKNPKP